MASRTPSSEWPRRRNRSSSITGHGVREIGYTVDTDDLLFTPERDYLIKNNGHKVRADDLKDKSIVLFIFPLGRDFTFAGDALDMIQAYNELSPMGRVEFVFVPVDAPLPDPETTQEDLFQHLFHTMPFPAIPLSDVQAFDGPVMKTFGLDGLDALYLSMLTYMPYWVVIDPSNTVVFTRLQYPRLFKLFGGAELHPLSLSDICSAIKEHDSLSRQDLINRWDHLLASPGRDYLLSCNGNTKVPISSLKGKVIGLYFCDNVPYPLSMQLINKVYHDAQSRGLDFEIVQINLPWHSFKTRHSSANLKLVQCPEGVPWLTLPFNDPSCRKLLRIFPSQVFEDYYGTWDGSCLVIIDARLGADDAAPFELSGAKILGQWGIEAYPFTRPSLFHTEYKIQKRDVTLRSLFPPGELLLLPTGELADASVLLSGKKVLVSFSNNTKVEGKFVSMLKSLYKDKDVAEEDKFEVVYVCTHPAVSFPSYGLPIRESDPCSAHPIPHPLLLPKGLQYLSRVFKGFVGYPAAAAFDSQGELIAKADSLDLTWEGHCAFPFISTDLESYVRKEVQSRFELESES